MRRNLDLVLAPDLFGCHPVDIHYGLLRDHIFSGYGCQVFEPLDTVYGIFLGLVISTVRLVVRRGLNLCCPGWCLCDPFFYRNQDDLVFLESFRVEMQVRIGVVDLLKGHIVSLADRVKGLTFLHYMRIVHFPVIADLVSGHHNLRRDVFLCGSYGAGRGRQT